MVIGKYIEHLNEQAKVCIPSPTKFFRFMYVMYGILKRCIKMPGNTRLALFENHLRQNYRFFVIFE